LAYTKLLYDNGKAKEVDVDRINVSYNTLQYQLKKANDGLTQSYNYLKFQMGMPVETIISLSDSVFFTQDSLLEQKISSQEYVKEEPAHYDNRNDYKILQTTLELQNLDKKNQIAQYLPSISAFGSYSYNGQRTSFDLFDSGKEWFKYYSVGLQFRLPIFTGGQTLARIQQSSLNVARLKEEIKKAENGIDMQILDAEKKYNNAYENIKTNRLNIGLAHKVYDITVLEYKEGETTAAALVDSETKLREAQTDFINSLLELYVAKFDLEKARGTLSIYLNNFKNNNQ
jgi:outer membrane protein TolC